MGLLIDPPAWNAHGRRWSHLVSDTSLTELHAFARRLGVPERGFEGDHYDIPEERYSTVVAAGAVPVSSRELLRRLRASGLRRPKRRGERVLYSRPDPRTGHRVDLLLSAKPPLGPVAAAHLLVWAEHAVVCLPDDVGLTLPSGPLRSDPGPLPGSLADPPETVGPAALAARAEIAALAGSVTGEPDAFSGSPAGPRPRREQPVQVGYLRRIAPGGPISGIAELVLGWRWSGVPVPPASWVPLAHAIGLLPAQLAPLVRHTVTGAR